MNTKIKKGLLLSSLILSSLSVLAGDLEGDQFHHLVDVGSKGNDLPVPFRAHNLRVELADGENYRLQGLVVMFEGDAFFHVDLDAHSWLANKEREKNPLYRLEADPSIHWPLYEGELIQIRVEAKGRMHLIEGDERMRLRYDLILKALEKPWLSDHPEFREPAESAEPRFEDSKRNFPMDPDFYQPLPGLPLPNSEIPKSYFP
jgi:hypothetical protein